MGLAVFPYLDEIIAERIQVFEVYNSHLDFSKISKMRVREDTNWNYSYYPILFQTEKDLLKAQQGLLEEGVFPRRYFYPSLNALPFVKANRMEVSENVACRILCLPLYKGLTPAEIIQTATAINNALK
jgi:dTDP-4-amino-4,6-dideoxygalactose transaminase